MARNQGPLVVRVDFEPNRLAADYLADAYAQVVPARCRRVRPACRKGEPWAGGKIHEIRVKEA